MFFIVVVGGVIVVVDVVVMVPVFLKPTRVSRSCFSEFGGVPSPCRGLACVVGSFPPYAGRIARFRDDAYIFHECGVDHWFSATPDVPSYSPVWPYPPDKSYPGFGLSVTWWL